MARLHQAGVARDDLLPRHRDGGPWGLGTSIKGLKRIGFKPLGLGSCRR